MNNYEILHPIGRGAYGNVYLYRRLSDNKHVVIKQIPTESITNAECEVTKNEVRVLAMFQHPNIIEYYDNYLDNNTIMIVMEYAPGGNLYDYLRSRGEGNLLPEEDVLNLFCQLIGDFGISKILSSKSKAHTVVGTPCYLSPELCQEKPYNQKSDIWALGCVLYEMLTLKRAFEAETIPALIMKIMRGIFAPIHPRYSAEMRSLVHLLLHMDPAQRPNIHQVISQPLIFPTLFKLHADLGMVRCVSRPLRLSSVGTRTRSSRGSEDSTDREKNEGEKKGVSEETRSVDKEVVKQPAASSCVYCWPPHGTPSRLSTGESEGEVLQVAASNTHHAGVTSAGQVVLWARQHLESKDRKGTKADNQDSPPSHVVPLTPTLVRAPSSATIVQVACGDGFMACVTNRGILLTCGKGSSGSLGHGNTSNVEQLRIVESLLSISVKEVACGSSHVVALSVDHQVFSWGCGDNGRLGIGSRKTQLWPHQIELPQVPDSSQYKVTGIEAGEDCTFLVTTEGVLFASGSNRSNKLCVDETDLAGCETLKQVEDVATFVAVCSKPLANAALAQVAAGKHHSLFVTESGEVFTSGSNAGGQLGHEGAHNPRVPRRVMEPLSRSQVVKVACARDLSLAVTEDGRVFSWGGGEAESEPSPPKEEVTAFEEPRIRTQNTFKNFVRPSLVSLKQSTRGKVLSIAASRELVLLCHKS
ncbi:putative serine/threonine-protein kinase Nek8-like [Penaeus vannamei]|uniref:non-specific serine/threonine protein kinase n=1 Tax=Penaeus vannamei TaxID=6689 RepID=A0A3R7Q4B9_PENVA|nr:putative serine/threonine-protein kinase Nek8-like [Penaeus vannamei]